MVLPRSIPCRPDLACVLLAVCLTAACRTNNQPGSPTAESESKSQAADDISLSNASTQLLDDHLRIRLPVGARVRQRMDWSAVIPNEQQTELTVPIDQADLVLVFTEMNAHATAAFSDNVTRALGPMRHGTLEKVTATSSAIEVLMLDDALGQAPDKLFAAVTGAYIRNTDASVQQVSAWIAHGSPRPIPEYRRLVRRMLTTLSSGQRTLTAPARALEMRAAECPISLTLQLTAGLVTTIKAGPDYTNYDIIELRPLNDQRGFLRVHIGHLALISDRKHIQELELVDGTLLNRKIVWKQWRQGKGQMFRECRVPLTDDPNGCTAYFAVSGPEEELAALDRSLATLTARPVHVDRDRR
ncbi:MAG: hypothetical protein RL701_1469 [Pseudomonadota bacterium]